MTTAALLVQVWIALTGLAAVGLLMFGDRARHDAAPFIGLLGQPAWLWHAADTGATGILIVSLAYTVVWAAGCAKVLRHMRKPAATARELRSVRAHVADATHAAHDLARDLLDPDALGHAATPEIRNRARAALGLQTREHE